MIPNKKPYSDVKVWAQSFKGAKVHVVPNQSMTLHEVLRRFTKKEALPVSKEGTYEDRYDYDLEKLAKEDITIQEDVLKDISKQMDHLKAKMEKDREEHAKKLATEAATQEAKDKERIAQLLKQQDPKT